MDEHAVTILSIIGMLAFVALSAYLLLLAGLISFGQQAFFAVGAYASGACSAMAGWPLAPSLAVGALAAATAGLLLALPTLRLAGLYFAMASLAFAEALRIGFELLVWRVEVDGAPVGPNGADGFRDIRLIYQMGWEPADLLALILALLLLVLAGLLWLERSRLGAAIRMAGFDPMLAAHQGVDVKALRIGLVCLAGALAGLGGGLYAHAATYVEPRAFDVMLGVHSLAYGLIGGLGTPLGPILGVVLDVGLLESTRVFAGYRMIVFGGLVALILIVRPRGLLDEATMHRLTAFFRRPEARRA
jgi:branched-chain amino acid transport system permease protein